MTVITFNTRVNVWFIRLQNLCLSSQCINAHVPVNKYCKNSFG